MGRRSLAGMIAALAAAALWAAAARAEVGFTQLSAPDPPGEAVQVGVWYPTDAGASDQRLGLFTQHVAPDGPAIGERRGLIVISHGFGGSLEGHYDTALALARAGFVVAAVTHTGDNYRDHSRALKIAERPRAIHAAIDEMLNGWSGRATIDPSRIGVFGFSSGGFTALVSVGGVPDLSAIPRYCADHAVVFVCQLVETRGDQTDRDPGGPWLADPRIRAAVVAAPALGFTFTAASLKGVEIPVQLWRAEMDHILPAPDYAEAVRDALPERPEYHNVPGADHFDFLAPCSDALRAVAPDICQEVGGFDRAAFHAQFNREVVGFFNRTMEGS